MNRILLSLTIVLYFVFIGCNLHKQMPTDDDTEYFEGEIEYSFVYESLNPDQRSEDIASNATDKRIQRFKNGNYVCENYRSDSLTGRTWFNHSTNKVYIQLTGSDTLYFYDTRNLDFILEPFEVEEGEDVMGYSTKKITLNFKGKDSTKFLTDESQYTYYIATDLPVNPDWYTNFLEFDFNKIMTTAPGTILKKENTVFGLRRMTRTATRIEEKPVDLDLSVDPSKTLVEI